MNEYTCDQCHRTHNRSRKCLYCGAGARHQKPTAAAMKPNPSPAPRRVITATQLEFPITTDRKPTPSQYKATAKFHRRMQELYKQVGRLEDSESARKAAERMEAEIRQAEAAEVTT